MKNRPPSGAFHRAAAGRPFGIGNGGFTLIELIVAISLISLLFMIAIPRVGRMVGSQRDKFAIVTGMLAMAFDDAFMNNRQNFFVVYLSAPGAKDEEPRDDVFGRKNGVAVLNFVDSQYVDSRRKALQFREFGDSFLIEDVLKQTGEKITDGHFFIPFYRGGYSSNCIIHVLVNGDQKWSIQVNKHLKEPKVIEGYETFDTEI